MKDTYRYKKHGLLWIVYKSLWTGIEMSYTEDSKWDSEEKAKEHCRLLNELK